jgi:Ubiquitin family
MEFLYFGLRFSAPRNFERVRIDNVDFNDKAKILKERLKSEILKNDIVLSDEEICLIFCGDQLEDNEPINKYKVRSGSTIHVMKMQVEEKPKEYSKFTEFDVSRVTSYYRSLNSGNFYVSFSFCAKMLQQ